MEAKQRAAEPMLANFWSRASYCRMTNPLSQTMVWAPEVPLEPRLALLGHDMVVWGKRMTTPNSLGGLNSLHVPWNHEPKVLTRTPLLDPPLTHVKFSLTDLMWSTPAINIFSFVWRGASSTKSTGFNWGWSACDQHVTSMWPPSDNDKGRHYFWVVKNPKWMAEIGSHLVPTHHDFLLVPFYRWTAASYRDPSTCKTNEIITMTSLNIDYCDLLNTLSANEEASAWVTTPNFIRQQRNAQNLNSWPVP